MEKDDAFYVMGFGALFMLLGLLRYVLRREYKREGIIVPGIVVNIELTVEASVRTYCPVVNYKTLEGLEIEKISSSGTNPASYKKGEHVQVVYKPEDPKTFFILNKKETYLELIVILIGLTGVVAGCFYLY